MQNADVTWYYTRHIARCADRLVIDSLAYWKKRLKDPSIIGGPRSRFIRACLNACQNELTARDMNRADWVKR